MVKKTMPSPPNQWMRLRQRRRLCGSVSMSVMAVAPVVVKPDMLSKKAAARRGSCPLKRKGRVPTTVKSIHDSDTQRYPSRRLMLLPPPRPQRWRMIPVAAAMAAGRPKLHSGFSPKA